MFVSRVKNRIIHLRTLLILILCFLFNSIFALEKPETNNEVKLDLSVNSDNWFSVEPISEDWKIHGISLMLESRDYKSKNSLQIKVFKILPAPDKYDFSLYELKSATVYPRDFSKKKYYTIFFKDESKDERLSNNYAPFDANPKDRFLINIIPAQPVSIYSNFNYEKTKQLNFRIVKDNIILGQIGVPDENKWNIPNYGMPDDCSQGDQGFSIIDFGKKANENKMIQVVEVHCQSGNNKIKLNIWREENDGWLLIKESEVLTAGKGFNTLKLKNPIFITKGDYIGFIALAGEISRTLPYTRIGKGYIKGPVKVLSKIQKDMITKDTAGDYWLHVFSNEEIDYELSEGLASDHIRYSKEGISIIDLEKRATIDTKLDIFEIYSLVPDNKVRLKIWSRDNDNWLLVGESELFTAKVGLNSFKLSKEIVVKEGDYFGFFTSSGSISRKMPYINSGRYFVQGDVVAAKIEDSKMNKEGEGGYWFNVGLSSVKNQDMIGSIYNNAYIKWVTSPMWGNLAGIILSDIEKPYNFIMPFIYLLLFEIIAIAILGFMFYGKRLIREKEKRDIFSVILITGFITAILYFATVCTGFLGGDNYEIQMAQYLYKDVHFPGYPIMILLGYWFGKLMPVGNYMYKANLFAVFCSSIGISFFAGALYNYTKHKASSILIALIMATTQTIWNYSVVAQDYSVSILFQCLLLFAIVNIQEEPTYKSYFNLIVIAFLAPIAHMTNAIGSLFIMGLTTIWFWRTHRFNIKKILYIVLSLSTIIIILYTPLALIENPTNYAQIVKYTDWKNQFVEKNTGYENIVISTNSLKIFSGYITGNGPGTNRRSGIIGKFSEKGISYIIIKGFSGYLRILGYGYGYMLIFISVLGLLLLLVYKKRNMIIWYLLFTFIGNIIFNCTEFFYYEFKYLDYALTAHQLPSIIILSFSIVGIVIYFLRNQLMKEQKVRNKLQYLWIFMKKNNMKIFMVFLVALFFWNTIKNYRLCNFRSRDDWEKMMSFYRNELIPGTTIRTHMYEEHVLGVFHRLDYTRRDTGDDRFSGCLSSQTISLNSDIVLPAFLDTKNRAKESSMFYITDKEIDKYFNLVPIPTKYHLRFIMGDIANLQLYHGFKDRQLYYALPKATAVGVNPVGQEITTANFNKNKNIFINNWEATPLGIRSNYIGWISNILIYRPKREKVKQVVMKLIMTLNPENKPGCNINKVDLAFYLNNVVIKERRVMSGKKEEITIEIPVSELSRRYNFLSIVPFYNGVNCWYPTPLYPLPKGEYPYLIKSLRVDEIE
ncbi:MAG: DUF2723 domain-containing protein [Elusimicrobia bacterium]|nr:DUF2723 domain-containing protein [Elusimicrobiota bacterium]